MFTFGDLPFDFLFEDDLLFFPFEDDLLVFPLDVDLLPLLFDLSVTFLSLLLLFEELRFLDCLAFDLLLFLDFKLLFFPLDGLFFETIADFLLLLLLLETLDLFLLELFDLDLDFNVFETLLLLFDEAGLPLLTFLERDGDFFDLFLEILLLEFLFEFLDLLFEFFLVRDFFKN